MQVKLKLMDKVYDHKKVEETIYKTWEEKDLFKPEVNPNGKPYSIILPPPNVTGTLHVGHALMLVIQDILIRFHRMKGNKALWLPGTDHSAIATQSKVESDIYKKEEKTRHDLGREEFLRRVEEFAKQSHDTIVLQIRKMGASVDWSREAYTLDAKRNFAVRTAFKKMYDEGLIYRGETIVNWDPKLQTTISDDEIEWKPESAPLYYLKYGPFTIATARPETKFGDKYVVMHPKDKRYKDYKDGQKIELEWINGKVTATVVKDEVIDMKFGTGVMTITPWHDKTDFEIAKKHNLDFEQIIDFNGKLLPIAKEFSGIHIKKARPLIVEKLKKKDLLVKLEDNYSHKIATNYRGGGTVEPQIKKQWLVSVDKEFILKHSEIEGIKSGSMVSLKKLMRQVVDNKQIKIIPSHFDKTYYHWIDNLHDWVISRQLWYGHRIPVWYKGNEVYSGVNPPEGEEWEQDPDTLDTWFSSGLWTFSTLGWPDQTEDLKEFHPTTVLETGYDILFFWVARMILMSTYLLGQVPFKNVLLHGLVRDAEKQKMSKSKGNVIDPVDVIDKYGTDALRMALVFSTATGNDIAMSEDKVRGMRNFTNKLWNMGRFIDMNRIQNSKFKRLNLGELIKEASNENDKKMIEKTQRLIGEVTKLLEKYDFNNAAQNLYDFTWHEFADIYIEDVKTRLDKDSYQVLNVLYYTLLQLLHPFMPFITEELYKGLFKQEDSIMISKWPSLK